MQDNEDNAGQFWFGIILALILTFFGAVMLVIRYYDEQLNTI